MRNIVLAMVIMIAVSIGNCMETDTRAYIDGFNAGFKMGCLAIQAQGNNTAVDLYNVEVGHYNTVMKALLDEDEYKAEELAYLPYSEYVLPPVFRQTYPQTNNKIVANSSYDLTEEQMEDAGIGLGNESWLGWI